MINLCAVQVSDEELQLEFDDALKQFQGSEDQIDMEKLKEQVTDCHLFDWTLEVVFLISIFYSVGICPDQRKENFGLVGRKG